MRIILAKSILLNLRSKTRQRATLLLLTWIYSCPSGETVNFVLTFTTNVTISISLLPTFHYSISARLWRFYIKAYTIYQGMFLLLMFIMRDRRLSSKLLQQGYVCERLKSLLRTFSCRYGDLI